MSNVRPAIRGFLTRAFRTADLGDDDDIFARGFVTSLFAMQLVMFVEREFGVSIGTEDLDVANFCSVTAMARLVERKRAATVAAGGLDVGA
jgi:methoxymalonate biosynthesis acyl carrier protein